MTPLAQHIVREFLRDRKTNKFKVADYNLPELLLDDCHCYDVTEVVELGKEMMLAKKDKEKLKQEKLKREKRLIEPTEESIKKTKSITELTYFSPSSKTWIEFNTIRHDRKDLRVGFFITNETWNKTKLTNDEFICVTYNLEVPIPILFMSKYRDINTWALYDSNNKEWIFKIEDETNRFFMNFCVSHIAASFLMINSPKVIARDIQPFHAGLRKDLSKYVPSQGRSKHLNEWHVIKLEVFKDGKEKHYSDDENKTLRGKMAYHYVRNFTRIRLGKLELVREHFRGDATIGTSKSYYNVTPGVPPESVNILDYI
jgi:hypothetical protein